MDVLERVKKLDKSTWISKNISKSLFADIPDNVANHNFAQYYLYKPTDDHYINLRELYLAYDDPTEYDFIVGVFGSVRLWDKIRKARYFKDHLKSYREELYVKRKSAALKDIAQIAAGEESSETTKLNALKWLAIKGYGEVDEISSPKPHANTYKKKGVESKIQDSVLEDMERLGLRVVNNV